MVDFEGGGMEFDGGTVGFKEGHTTLVWAFSFVYLWKTQIVEN